MLRPEFCPLMAWTRTPQLWPVCANCTGLKDEVLLAAVDEIGQDLIDADLGGHVVKKRIGTRGRGKRASQCLLRT